MMRGRLDRFHSPDVRDLRAFAPEDPCKFGFPLQFFVGSQPDGGGSDAFAAIVCTPEWLRAEYSPKEILSGRHKIIVFEYDYDRLWAYVEKYCSTCWGETWEEVAAGIGRLGRWEFLGMKKGLPDP